MAKTNNRAIVRSTARMRAQTVFGFTLETRFPDTYNTDQHVHWRLWTANARMHILDGTRVPIRYATVSNVDAECLLEVPVNENDCKETPVPFYDKGFGMYS